MLSALIGLWQQPVHSWSVVDYLILVMVVAGAVGITLIVLRVAGITVPPWAWQIGLIVLAVFLGIVAVRFLVSM